MEGFFVLSSQKISFYINESKPNDMIKRIRKAIFKINDEVIGTLDASVEKIDDITDVKCELAIQHKVVPEDIEVVYKEDYIEFGDLYITPSGKLCFDNAFWNPEEVVGFSMVTWVNEKTEEGINTILDYIKLKKFDELVNFNKGYNPNDNSDMIF